MSRGSVSLLRGEAFSSMIGIGKMTMQYLQSSMIWIRTGAYAKDARGKHDKSSHLKYDVIKLIKDKISSFTGPKSHQLLKYT